LTTAIGGPYGDSIHYSGTTNSYAEVVVNSGASVTLYYTGLSNRGTVYVYLDNTKIGEINEYSGTTAFQATQTIPLSLTAGSHVLKFLHYSGSYVDIDAVRVNP
jgi:hypothetical protein